MQAPAQQAPPPTATPTAAVASPRRRSSRRATTAPTPTLAVKGITNEPQYVVGDQPKFTMVVTNIGLVACQRDVGAAVLAAYVYSLDNQRLWSNLDCAPSNETLIKTFQPGEQVTTEVTWTGMGSAPNCPLPRQPIGPAPTTWSSSWATCVRRLGDGLPAQQRLLGGTAGAVPQPAPAPAPGG